MCSICVTHIVPALTGAEQAGRQQGGAGHHEGVIGGGNAVAHHLPAIWAYCMCLCRAQNKVEELEKVNAELQQTIQVCGLVPATNSWLVLSAPYSCNRRLLVLTTGAAEGEG